MSTRSANPVDIHVGKRIRMRRMTLDMSQSALAEPSGITFQQIQKYEKGTNRVGASRLQQFAKLLGVPVSFFFEGLASPETKRKKNVSVDLAEQLLATRLGMDLTKAFLSINQTSLRRAVVALVEEIARH